MELADRAMLELFRRAPVVIPWISIDAAPVPGGGGVLRLGKRGAEFSIMLGQTELMNSRLSGSEEALATMSLARIQGMSARTFSSAGLAWASHCGPHSPSSARTPGSPWRNWFRLSSPGRAVQWLNSLEEASPIRASQFWKRMWAA
jgi:hypothetical protein